MNFIIRWWSERIKAGNECLPENLKGKLHNDWIFPLSKIPRAATAFNWKQPPITLLGYNVKRWDGNEHGEQYTFNNYPFGSGFVGFTKRPIINGKEYGANAIQKVFGTWKLSFHVTFPLALHCTVKLWSYKKPTLDEIERGYDGVRLIYFRIGARWDSYDDYYNLGFFLGTTYN